MELLAFLVLAGPWVLGLTFLAGCYMFAVAFCTAPYITDTHPDALTSMDRRELGLR